MTKKQAEKKGYVPIKVEIELHIHPKTRNLLFPCGADGRLFDRYVYLTDPDEDSDEVVALRCKDHRRKWQKRSIATTIESLLKQGAMMWLNDKWTKLTKKKIKELQEKYDWFPVIEVQF